ncbi:MAG TPA: GlsB/YeaQ/YmgE family stress response membrane protein [Candidatus Limnocylindrales bacterium]|nr:GlsB/YeaQ/YmgE family stress response membrane protein [Candidatus Limnocylindrales bacterium]
MGLLTWLIVGVIAGWLASIVVRGGGFGLIGNIIVGVVGAFIGGWIAGEVFNIQNAISGFNLTTIIVASLGAVLVLFIMRMFRR